jgi:hypothetical protein
MRRRDRWQVSSIRRQRNVLPEDSIRNTAFVEGFLLRGDRRFSPLQKVGAVVIGVLYSSPGIAGLIVSGLLFAHPDQLGSVAILIVPILVLVSLGWLYLGGRMLRNVIRQTIND